MLFMGIAGRKPGHTPIGLENVLPFNSLGFRKGLRTENGIVILTNLLDKCSKREERVITCFVDFAKF